MTYTPGRPVGSPEQDVYQSETDPGATLPHGTPYTWHQVDSTGAHVDTWHKVAGRADLTVNMDAAVTALAEDPTSAFAVSQSSTYARRDTGARVEAGRNGVTYGAASDQTAAFQALINSVAAFGGGVIELDGVVRCDGQIIMPSTTVSTQVRQAPIRITGTAQNMPGSTWTGANEWDTTPGLDLRYAGRTDANCGTTLGSSIVLNAAAVAGDRGNIVTGTGVPDQAWILAVEPGVSWTLSRAARATGTVSLTSFGGRLQTLGYGMLELDHLQLVSGAASSAPFVLSTATTIKAHHNLFYGSTTKNRGTCDEDPFVLGGPGQGTALTSALTSGVSYTSLAVDALPVGINAGGILTLNAGCGTTQNVTVPNAVAAGATSIPVTSFTANANYPTRTSVYVGGWQKQESAEAWSVPSAPFQGYGTHITDNHFHRCRRISIGGYATSVWIDNNAWMHNCGSNLAVTPSTLTTQITLADTVTSLAVTALAAPVIVGDVIQVGVGTTVQEFTAAAPAAAGATAVTVTSVAATATFAVGVKVFNSTAGLGAAFESHPLPASVNSVYLRDNRIGMSGGYTHLTRLMGVSLHSSITGNEWQDAHANNIAGHRFDSLAQYNLVIPGMKATADATHPIMDDQAAALPSQTLLTARQSARTELTQGLKVRGELVEFTRGIAPMVTDTSGNYWREEFSADRYKWNAYTPANGLRTILDAKIAGATGYLALPSVTDGNSILSNYSGHLYIRSRTGYKTYIGDDTYGSDTYVTNGQLSTKHLIVVGTAPAIAAAGSSTSVSIAGQDMAATISLTTADGLTAGTAAATITFARGWASVGPNSTPRIVLTAGSLATATAQPFISAKSATAYSVAFANPPATATAMVLDVLVLGS